MPFGGFDQGAYCPIELPFGAQFSIPPHKPGRLAQGSWSGT